jgi:hypothetical protein
VVVTRDEMLDAASHTPRGSRRAKLSRAATSPALIESLARGARSEEREARLSEDLTRARARLDLLKQKVLDALDHECQ